jgi:hypothetical protein
MLEMLGLVAIAAAGCAAAAVNKKRRASRPPARGAGVAHLAAQVGALSAGPAGLRADRVAGRRRGLTLS